MPYFVFGAFILFSLFLPACSTDATTGPFQELGKSRTGIDFRNLLKEDENFNIFKYQYFNNGGGVAVGDFNNDGLQDVVFTGNMVKNRLYINQGNLRFKDITSTSGIAEKEGWCTGVTTVDINQDGWLDLYICRAAYPFEDLRKNLLFINNGDLTFSEEAANYGIDDSAHSTHSSFFDYDKDGDLDLFLLNHSRAEYSKGNLDVVQLQNKQEPEHTNKLFRNDGNSFTDVTASAGIYNNVLTFSLGIGIADVNNDNWPDIFVGNDFHEPDYLFINQQNGSFIDASKDYFDHTSMFSMGVDIADINNDGWQDMISLDMLPRTNYQQKKHAGADNFERTNMLANSGFDQQFSRNVLQLNNRDGSFSEIGQFVGVSNTNWSWSPLFFDFDNDGKKDLFIGNGYPKDHTDLDFLNFTANEVLRMEAGGEPIDFNGYMEQMPPILVSNYFYHHKEEFAFEDESKNWGLTKPYISQSAAYADLDNDGDLDLILNNTGEYATVYKNNSTEESNYHFLRITLAGPAANPKAIGAKVYLYANDQVYFQEQQPVRGFQSSVDPILHFGLGENEVLDSVVVIGPLGMRVQQSDVVVDQNLLIDLRQDVSLITKARVESTPLFSLNSLIEFSHEDDAYNDFNTQFLLPWTFSRTGPALAIDDLNGDGREDMFLGNGKGFSAQVLMQTLDGAFNETATDILDGQSGFEDTDAVIADFNQDGRPDIYIGSGSYEWPSGSPFLEDRLLINQGNGHFRRSEIETGVQHINTSCTIATDIDNDGDIDIFIGGGFQHERYPYSDPSQLLINNGNGQFEAVVVETANVTAASWCDLNQDGQEELVTVGEWTSIQIFSWRDGALIDVSNDFLPEPQPGIWSSLHAFDFDADGDLDIIAGNLGTNNQLNASQSQPLQLYADDFDRNGSVDPLLFYHLDGQLWPYFSREDHIGQLPQERSKFPQFEEYANATLGDLLNEEQLKGADKFVAHSLETTLFENVDGILTARSLPRVVQLAPVHAISSSDVNGDGHLDLILAGNTLQARVSLGRLNANHGQLLLGDGQAGFSAVGYDKSGLFVRERTNAISPLIIGDESYLLFARNDAPLLMYKQNE